MKEASEFFDKFRDGVISGLNTCTMAEIVSFDPVGMKADIELLPGRDLVQSVPVAAIRSGGFFVRVPFLKGDTVLVVFSQRDIDGVIYGELETTERMLAIDDAIIVGGITLQSKPLPGANAADLVIGKMDMSAKIVLTAAGGVEITAPEGITLHGKNSTQSW